MIAKSLILFLLLILIPDLYLGIRYLRKRRWWQQVLGICQACCSWWLPFVWRVGVTSCPTT